MLDDFQAPGGESKISIICAPCSTSSHRRPPPAATTAATTQLCSFWNSTANASHERGYMLRIVILALEHMEINIACIRDGSSWLPFRGYGVWWGGGDWGNMHGKDMPRYAMCSQRYRNSSHGMDYYHVHVCVV